MRAAIRPATTGVENEVPLQRAMPKNCPSGRGSGGSWYVYVPTGKALMRFCPGA
jgi:hypothetical protein